MFPEEQPGSWPLLILCRDRHGLLAKICGILSLHNLSVLAAKIFTWPDGTVADVLHVKPTAAVAFDEQNWQLVENDLNRAINYRLDVGFQLHSRLDGQSSRRPVHGCDHLGALYQLTQPLSDFRLSIHRARIATEVEQLIDVFYVTSEDRRKIEDAARLAEIRHALLHVLGEEAVQMLLCLSSTPCKAGLNIFPELRTLAARRALKVLPQSVFVTATIAGMYMALRRKAWPILDRRGFLRTLLPDSY